MAIAVGQLDPSILEKFGNVNKDAQNNAMLQQAANIDAASKANIYKTQVLSAAAGSGDPNVVNAAFQHLSQNGIDTSDVPTDIPSLTKYTDAARLAQSPLGSLLGVGLKGESNLSQAAQNTGSYNTAAAVAPLSAAIASKISGLTNPGAMPAGQAASMPVSAVNQGLINILQKPVAIDDPNQPAIGISQTETPGALIQTPQGNPAALANLPAAQIANQTLAQNTAPQFTFRDQNPGETIGAYQNARDSALKQFEMNNAPAIEQAKSQAGAIGKGIGDTTVKAGTATALSDRVMQGLDAMNKINEGGKLPYSGDIVGPETQTAISNRFGSNPIANAVGINQDAANATQAFTKANKQQVIVGLQDMLAAAPQGSRLSRQLLALVDDANGIDTNASQESIRNQIGILRNEVKNIGISENNTLQNLTGGQQQPYNAIPIQTPAPGQSTQPVSYKDYFK